MTGLQVDSEHKLRARDLLRATALRVTGPRQQTLALLLASGRALSHGELRNEMPKLDRVSLYRALECLLDNGLAFRIDDDGQHRYGASHQEQGHQHPHFRCSACGLTTCLSNIDQPLIQLPKGFRLCEVELLAKGLCDTCAHSGG